MHLIDHVLERAAGHVGLNNDNLLRLIAIVYLQDLMKIRMLYIIAIQEVGVALNWRVDDELINDRLTRFSAPISLFTPLSIVSSSLRGHF